MQPDFNEEEILWKAGYTHIAGIDEVGRGPLAGPVVAAAVVLSRDNRPAWLAQVRDSKKLAPKKRQYLSACIWDEAISVGIGEVDAEMIDREGIVPATKQAMCIAVSNISGSLDFLLIDAISLPKSALPQKSIIKGDNISLSIAAASIVAKVYRDNLITQLDCVYPGYGFAKNKGYPTPEHILALQELGYCPIHRQSFTPLSDMKKALRWRD